MKPFLLAAFFVAATASSAAAQCTVTGIATADFGTGTGYFPTPPVLKVGFDATNCALDVKIDAIQCCNTFITSHYLLYGTTLFSSPFPLPSPPWVPGALLYLFPDDAIGPLPGVTSSIVIPPNPLLPGMTFFLQALPIYFTTIGMTTDFGITQGIKMQFM